MYYLFDYKILIYIGWLVIFCSSKLFLHFSLIQNPNCRTFFALSGFVIIFSCITIVLMALIDNVKIMSIFIERALTIAVSKSIIAVLFFCLILFRTVSSLYTNVEPNICTVSTINARTPRLVSSTQ